VLGSSLIVEAGCPHGWSGRREALGAGDRTGTQLVVDLVSEHDRVAGCVVAAGLGFDGFPYSSWHVVGGPPRLEALAKEGVI
jgi:hypothetical protein